MAIRALSGHRSAAAKGVCSERHWVTERAATGARRRPERTGSDGTLCPLESGCSEPSDPARCCQIGWKLPFDSRLSFLEPERYLRRPYRSLLLSPVQGPSCQERRQEEMRSLSRSEERRVGKECRYR